MSSGMLSTASGGGGSTVERVSSSFAHQVVMVKARESSPEETSSTRVGGVMATKIESLLGRGGGGRGGCNKDALQEKQEQEQELMEQPRCSSSSSAHPSSCQTKGTNDDNHLSNSLGCRARDYGYKYEFQDDNDDHDDADYKEKDGNCLEMPSEEEDDCGSEDDYSESILEQATFLPGDGATTSSTENLQHQPQESLYTNKYSHGGVLAIDEEKILYLLGKCYHLDRDYEQRRDDELSLFWFTYRCDFPEMVPYGITSDAGWGCMLRSAQMLLAQALRVHFKSRSYKSHRLSIAQRRREPFLRSLLTWMADFPSASDNVYSLHNMVAAGMKHEILPGEWYGPGTACYVVRDLVEAQDKRQLALWKKRQQLEQEQRQQATNETSTQNKSKTIPSRVFRVYVASQATVYADAVRDLMTTESRIELEEQRKRAESGSGPKEVPTHPLEMVEEEEKEKVQQEDSLKNMEWDTGLLLLIPLRLGLKGLNEGYSKSLAHSFSFPQSVGVLGGRPRGARWFYGANADGSKILGLDPHTVQTPPRRRTARVNGRAMQVVDISEEYLRSVHTTNQEAVPLLRMDPSIALGFYCRNAADLDHLRASMKQWKTANPDLPELFTFAEASPDYATGAMSSSLINDLMAADMACSLLDNEDPDSCEVSDEEEYVLL